MQKYALIGHNISYSRSPEIHNEIYKTIGLEAEYEVISLEADELEKFTKYAKENLKGFNITKPYKEKIIPFLDYADGKSVNTVVNREGKLYGYSTDGYGFTRHAQLEFGKMQGKALVLGAGGVARVIIPELKNMGITVYLWNRSEDKGKALATELGVNYTNREDIAPNLIVNCTSFGFNEGENPVKSEGKIVVDGKAVKWVYDTIYSPPKTELLKTFSSAKNANGYGMLVLQAVQADRIMCGEITKEQEEKIYETLIAKQ